jgi:RHS repeat-associated protein
MWRGTVNGSVNLSYNNDFNISSQSINGGNSVSFDYDNDGLPVRVGNLKLAYDSLSARLVSDTLGAIVSNYTYNGFGEPAAYSVTRNDTILFRETYERDALGRITSLGETTGGNTKQRAFVYDSTYRLVQVLSGDSTISRYVYDSNGNRLAAVINGVADSATYDAQDRMSSYAGTSFGYTKNGTLSCKVTGQDTTRYYYDNFGNLLRVTLPNKTIIDYIIDGQNRRVGRKVNGVLTNRLLYSGTLNPVAELDTAGQVLTRFVYGPKSNVPDYYIKHDTVYKIISDHLGSPRLVINAVTGAVVFRADYDEFGRLSASSGTLEVPFGFAGGIYDSLTGLTRFGARDYSAREGRWTAKDPIDFDGGDLNLYGYCFSDPINSLDNEGTSIAQACFYTAGCGSVALAIQQGWQYFNEYYASIFGDLTLNIALTAEAFNYAQMYFAKHDKNVGQGGNWDGFDGINFKKSNGPQKNKEVETALKWLGFSKLTNDQIGNVLDYVHKQIHGLGLEGAPGIKRYIESSPEILSRIKEIINGTHS